MLLDVHVDVMTCVTVRVEDTVRAHTDMLRFLYLYLYIYPYLPSIRMVDAGVTV